MKRWTYQGCKANNNHAPQYWLENANHKHALYTPFSPCALKHSKPKRKRTHADQPKPSSHRHTSSELHTYIYTYF